MLGTEEAWDEQAMHLLWSAVVSGENELPDFLIKNQDLKLTQVANNHLIQNISTN